MLPPVSRRLVKNRRQHTGQTGRFFAPSPWLACGLRFYLKSVLSGTILSVPCRMERSRRNPNSWDKKTTLRRGYRRLLIGSGRLLFAVILILSENQIIDIGRLRHLRPNMHGKTLLLLHCRSPPVLLPPENAALLLLSISLFSARNQANPCKLFVIFCRIRGFSAK